MTAQEVIHQLSRLAIFGFRKPAFALQLARARLDFLRHRKLTRAYVDPAGYRIDTPEKLFAWWALFIDGNLVHPTWTSALTSAKSPHVIDVGANAGVFIHLVLGVNPSARITAVEPQPQLVHLIQDYANCRAADVRCIAMACSDHAGVATLFLEDEGDARASLDPKFASPKKQLKIEVTTLDAIAPNGEILLLKIDAEGHDIQVLQGATATLKRTQFVLIECHKPETFSEAKAILSGWQSYQVGPYDFLFAAPAV